MWIESILFTTNANERDYEKIKKSDYYLKNGYVRHTVLEKNRKS